MGIERAIGILAVHKTTGEKHRFPTIVHAAGFLGCSPHAVRKRINGYQPKHKPLNPRLSLFHVMRDPDFVPDKAKISAVMSAMAKAKSHMPSTTPRRKQPETPPEPPRKRPTPWEIRHYIAVKNDRFCEVHEIIVRADKRTKEPLEESGRRIRYPNMEEALAHADRLNAQQKAERFKSPADIADSNRTPSC